jgi:hypothetical protein
VTALPGISVLETGVALARSVTTPVVLVPACTVVSVPLTLLTAVAEPLTKVKFGGS